MAASGACGGPQDQLSVVLSAELRVEAVVTGIEPGPSEPARLALLLQELLRRGWRIRKARPGMARLEQEVTIVLPTRRCSTARGIYELRR